MCLACGIPTHVVGTEPAVVAQTRFAALRNADCRTYITGAALSMMGDSIEHVITYWVMFQQFHQPALAGFAVISHWAPSLFSFYTGAWADRADCRKIIQLAQVLFMSVSASWGVLILTHSLQMWHALVLLLLHGIANVVWAPAEQLMLHDLVGRPTLPSAVRLNSTFRSVGFLAGPAVGSVLLLTLGPSLGIFVNVVSFLPLTIWLSRTHHTGHIRDAVGAARARVSPRAALHVLRDVARQPVLLSMMALGGAGSLLIGSGMSPQMPEFATDLGVGDAGGLGYGALIAANSAGAVLGGMLLESTGLLKPSARTAMFSTLGWSVCLIGFAVSRNYPISLALLLGAGVFNLASQSIAQTLVQLLAPAEKRGRIVGVFNMASNGLKAGSGFTIGLAGGLIGIHWSLGLSAVLLGIFVACLVVYSSRATSPNLGQSRTSAEITSPA
ncbi:MAG: MFS transporter [Chloroflexi bacterium]|nr:MFS transporter [Chloroflexota bacterium]